MIYILVRCVTILLPELFSQLEVQFCTASQFFPWYPDKEWRVNNLFKYNCCKKVFNKSIIYLILSRYNFFQFIDGNKSWWYSREWIATQFGIIIFTPSHGVLKRIQTMTDWYELLPSWFDYWVTTTGLKRNTTYTHSKALILSKKYFLLIENMNIQLIKKYFTWLIKIIMKITISKLYGWVNALH